MMAEHRLVPSEKAMKESTFFARLDEIKADGYVSEDSAHTIGVTNISCPVLDPFGVAIAALTCPFVERIDSPTAPNRPQAVKTLCAAARDLGPLLTGRKQIAEAET